MASHSTSTRFTLIPVLAVNSWARSPMCSPAASIPSSTVMVWPKANPAPPNRRATIRIAMPFRMRCSFDKIFSKSDALTLSMNGISSRLRSEPGCCAGSGAFGLDGRQRGALALLRIHPDQHVHSGGQDVVQQRQEGAGDDVAELAPGLVHGFDLASQRRGDDRPPDRGGPELGGLVPAAAHDEVGLGFRQGDLD